MYVNGTKAEAYIKYAFGLLALLIIAMAVLAGMKTEIPNELSSALTVLLGGTVGFLFGTRVIPPEVSEAWKKGKELPDKDTK